MRRPIIYLIVALLTFAFGTIASLLFHGAFTSSSKVEKRQGVVAVSTESQSAPVMDGTETVSERCGCANVDSDSVAPASDSSKAPIRGGILNDKAISLPKPPYPPIARAARASGTVAVEVIVDERGCIQSAHAVSGHPLLQMAAVQAARHACFSPTRLQGQPVKVSGVITYNFVVQPAP
jgi:TonB family protein